MKLTQKTLYSQLLPLFLVLLATFLAYSHTLNFSFVWDDYTFILNWDQPRHLAANFLRLLAGEVAPGHTGVYRPVRSLIYALSFALWHQNPTAYHAQALFLHLFTTTTVFFLAKLLTGNSKVSLVSSLIFGLHPVHIETITFITTSFDAIGILFACLSLLSFLYYRQHHSRLLQLSTLLFATLAFFTYEITLLLPLLLILTASYLFPSDRPTKIASLQTLIPLFFYLFIRFAVLQIPSRHSNLFSDLFTQAHFALLALLHYAKLAFFPHSLTVNYHLFPDLPGIFYYDSPFPTMPHLPHFLLHLSLFLTLLILFFFLARVLPKSKLILYLGFWFTLALVPVLQFVPQDIIFSQKYLYFATIPFSIFFSFTFFAIIKSLLHRSFPKFFPAALTVGLGFYLIFLFTNTYSYNQSWENPKTLWTRSVISHPQSAIAHNNLGSYYFATGNYDLALSLFQRSLHLNPHHPLTHSNLGLLLSKLSRYQEAVSHLETATQLEPGNSQYLLHLASAYTNSGQLEKAKQIYHQLIQTPSVDPSLYQALATIYHQQQNLDQAIIYYQKVIDTDPQNSADAHNNLANIYLALGNRAQALYHLQEALRLNPNHPFALSTLQEINSSTR